MKFRFSRIESITQDSPAPQSTKHKTLETFLILYHAKEVNNEALQLIQKAVCTSAITTIFGIGYGRWSLILGQSRKSTNVKQYGNASSNNTNISSPVIRNLTNHFC